MALSWRGDVKKNTPVVGGAVSASALADGLMRDQQ